MLARDFARPCHVVDLHCDAIVAARMLCAGSESFLVMVDSSGEPHSFIQARDILGHLLSDSLRAEPGLLSHGAVRGSPCRTSPGRKASR